MPTYPEIINALLTTIIDDLPDNDQELITAEVLRGVLQEMTTGIYDALGLPNDVQLADFPAYDAGTTYTGGASDVVVKHNSQLWLFVSPTNQTGVTPGTNPTVWIPFSLLGLAHFKNMDTWLDKPGPFAVTAQQIREHLENENMHFTGLQLKEFDVNVTAAQMADLINTPVGIIPDPGANKVIIDERFYIMKGADQGSEDFDQSVWLEWNDGTVYADAFGAINPSVDTLTPIPFTDGAGAIGVPVVGKGLRLVLSGVTDFSQGDHDVRLLGKYLIKSL